VGDGAVGGGGSFSEAGATGGIGGGGIDAPIGTGTAVNGDSCASGSDCQTGNCVGGLCCDKECKDACYACAQLYTGKSDGTCAAVGSGQKDPHAVCVNETATKECGSDGTCDGAGACRKGGTDQVCATAFCTGAMFTPTSTCDGKGACKTVTALDCGTAPCDINDGCRSACATDKDCSGGYCNATTQRCAAQKINGDTCSSTNECSSGFCVDGVCCEKACTDKCMACSSSLTTAKSGICSAVKVGTDPHDSCAADTTNECGLDGTCDGAGACRIAGKDHGCKPATCTDGSFIHAATCDGKGVCGAPLSESCGAFTCDPTNGCQKACTADTDCTGKSYCDATTKTCTAQKDNGKACAAGKECTSTNCVDGMCCNSKCDGTCNSCKKDHTNVADGTCASVVTGKDPYNSCQDETAINACGNTGNCDGTGACQKVDKSKTCGTASCNSATFTPASMCDGLGVCKPGSKTDCGQYQCSITTGCLTTCQTDADCSTSTYCDSTKVCSPKKKPGEACVGTDGTKCTTSNCVDGVCCTTNTCQSCYACNINGNGTCAASGSGTADLRGVCKAGTTACGQDGKCDGSGNCTYSPALSATCSPTTCSVSTKTTHTCDASHSCAETPSACSNSLKCNSAGTDCLPSCTSNSDCLGGYYCAGGTCQKQLDLGTTCTTGTQCGSGNCVDGFCCDGPCSGICQSCSATPGKCTNTASPHPNKSCPTCQSCSNGTCQAVSSGTACYGGVCNSAQSCVPCTQNASCTTGIGECQTGSVDCSSGAVVCTPSNKGNGISCGSGPTCSGGTKSYGQWTCQGGTCTQPTYTPCQSTGCNTSTGLCNAACGTGGTAGPVICGSSCCGSAQTCYNGGCCSPTSCSGRCSGTDNCGNNCPNNCGSYACYNGSCCTNPISCTGRCSGTDNCGTSCPTTCQRFDFAVSTGSSW
jgi:hypothetical protein